jgi:hypothetical protein
VCIQKETFRGIKPLAAILRLANGTLVGIGLVARFMCISHAGLEKPREPLLPTAGREHLVLVLCAGLGLRARRHLTHLLYLNYVERSKQTSAGCSQDAIAVAPSKDDEAVANGHLANSCLRLIAAQSWQLHMDYPSHRGFCGYPHTLHMSTQCATRHVLVLLHMGSSSSYAYTQPWFSHAWKQEPLSREASNFYTMQT